MQFKQLFLREIAQRAAICVLLDPEHCSKSHGFAQNLRIALRFLVHEVIEVFKPRTLAFVRIAVQQGEAQKHPLRVFKAAQICPRGVVKTDLCSVIGVRAPANIVQQTGRFDQAFALQRGRFKQWQDEVIKRAAKTGQTRVFCFGKAASLDERIAVAQTLRHLFIKQTLSDAIGGQRDVFGPKRLEQPVQHFGGKGHKAHPLR